MIYAVSWWCLFYIYLLHLNTRFYTYVGSSNTVIAHNLTYHKGTIYNVFGMTRSLSGIEPWTSRTRSEHSTTRLYRGYCIQLKNANCVNVLHKNNIWLESVTVDIYCAKVNIIPLIHLFWPEISALVLESFRFIVYWNVMFQRRDTDIIMN